MLPKGMVQQMNGGMIHSCVIALPGINAHLASIIESDLMPAFKASSVNWEFTSVEWVVLYMLDIVDMEHDAIAEG